MIPQLQTKDLCVTIRAHKILNGVDLTVMPGETIGIVGPNGCGKTTFFNAISGFVPTFSGSIHFAGKSIGHLSAFERAKLGLGRVFQSFGVFRDMTVGENMILALENREYSWRGLLPWSCVHYNNRQQAIELLKEVKLQDKIDELASSLSGGQQRLLEIVRAKAFGSSTLLLDEPTAGVSPRMKEDVIQMIRSLQQEGKTVLIIEHDVAFVSSFCNRIVVFNEGRIVLDGPPAEIVKSQLLKEIYFGHTPMDSKLASQIPD